MSSCRQTGAGGIPDPDMHYSCLQDPVRLLLPHRLLHLLAHAQVLPGETLHVEQSSICQAAMCASPIVTCWVQNYAWMRQAWQQNGEVLAAEWFGEDLDAEADKGSQAPAKRRVHAAMAVARLLWPAQPVSSLGWRCEALHDGSPAALALHIGIELAAQPCLWSLSSAAPPLDSEVHAVGRWLRSGSPYLPQR